MVTQKRLGHMTDNWIDVSDRVSVKKKYKVMVCTCGRKHKVIKGLLSRECNGCGNMIFDPKFEGRPEEDVDEQAEIGWFDRDDDNQTGLEEWS